MAGKYEYRDPKTGKRVTVKNRAQAEQMRQASSIRRYADDDFDDNELDWQDRQAARKARNGCLIAFLVFVLILAIAILLGVKFYKDETGGRRATASEAVTLNLDSSNASGSKVGAFLAENGLIGNETVFKLYVKYLGDSSTFKAGEHTITPGMSYDEILAELAAVPPQRQTVQIRVPEGSSIMSIARIFVNNGLCESAEEFLDVADNGDFSDLRFVQKLDEDFAADLVVLHRAEGLLFPDTYDFYTDDTVYEVVRKLYEQMDSKFTDEMYNRMDEMGLSLREVLTLASMIEAEASGHADEMPHVSRVFFNRLGESWQEVDGTMGSNVTGIYLKKWMQLNMDEYGDRTFPTISSQEVYDAMGEDLYYAYVTRIDGGYSAHKGLPNGPICSVSLDAINAALYPTEDPGYMDYYYFVTDAYDTFYYAKTNAEHDQNVAIAEQKDREFAAEQAQQALDNTEEGAVD